jgi:hypothetical protein
MGYERIKVLENEFRLSREEAKEIDTLMTKIRKVSGREVEKIMKRINELINGFGVESIRGDYVSHFWQDTVALYVNMGDTYDTTILFNTNTKMPMITDMGYFVEKNTRKYNIQ